MCSWRDLECWATSGCVQSLLLALYSGITSGFSESPGDQTRIILVQDKNFISCPISLAFSIFLPHWGHTIPVTALVIPQVWNWHHWEKCLDYSVHRRMGRETKVWGSKLISCNTKTLEVIPGIIQMSRSTLRGEFSAGKNHFNLV